MWAFVLLGCSDFSLIFGNDPPPDATEVNTDAPVIQIRPRTLDFGEWATDAAYASQGVEITNEGTGVLEVDAGVLQGDGFWVQSADASTLPPGATLEWRVAFEPDQAGSYAGSLRVDSSDPDAPSLDVTLLGRGI